MSASEQVSAFTDLTRPVLACDGQGLKRLLQASLQWLGQHTDVINSLNVFPVPDGDTGTNMYLTLQAACQEIEDRSDQQVSTRSCSILSRASRTASRPVSRSWGMIDRIRSS